MEQKSEGLKVMVIDDSKTIRRTAETLLKKVGCEVITAVDGFDALAKSIAERVYAAASKKMTVVDLHDDRLAQEKMKAMQMRLNLNKNKGGLN